jgi:hypothetical protein
MKHCWNDADREEQNLSVKKTCTNAIVFNRNRTWTDLKLNCAFAVTD